jgi:hypothetical protein
MKRPKKFYPKVEVVCCPARPLSRGGRAGGLLRTSKSSTRLGKRGLRNKRKGKDKASKADLVIARRVLGYPKNYL